MIITMNALTITNILGTTLEDISEKKHNIFVGISLGSKFFTEHNIREYILWACEHSMHSVIVLVVDKPHSVNYELRSGYNHSRAYNVAMRKGNEMAKTIQFIVDNLSETSRCKVKVIRWQNVEHLNGYSEEREMLYRCFRDNSLFHQKIIDIVADNVASEIHRFSQNHLDRLASYILDELPVLLRCFMYGGKVFGVHPYPKLSRLHDLILQLQNGLYPDVYKHKYQQCLAFVELNY